MGLISALMALSRLWGVFGCCRWNNKFRVQAKCWFWEFLLPSTGMPARIRNYFVFLFFFGHPNKTLQKLPIRLSGCFDRMVPKSNFELMTLSLIGEARCCTKPKGMWR